MPLTIQYVPYEEMTGLDSEKRIQKLLKVVRQNRVVLMEGTLSPEEEAGLIEETMQLIDNKFKGVEISSFSPFDKNTKLLQEKIRQLFLPLCQKEFIKSPQLMNLQMILSEN